MLNIKSKWTGLIAIAFALFAGVEAAKANTLVFNEQLTQHGQTLRWESPFDGQIQLTGILNTDMYDLDTNIWVDDILLDTLSIGTAPHSGISVANSTKELKSNWVLDVQKGTVLDFSMNASNSSPTTSFNAEISFLHSPNSLVFLQPEGSDSFLHVGLLRNGRIYEASPAYPTGNYWDVFQQKSIAITSDNGVQNQHTLGSFLHLSEIQNNSAIQKYDIIEISEEEAAAMEQFLNSQMSKGYTFKSSYPFLQPYAQKGYYGTYTGAGLIERAAEEAGIKSGQGFIWNSREFIHANRMVASQDAPWECLTVFPTSVQCSTQYGNRNPSSGMAFSLLSPAFLHYVLTHEIDPFKDVLSGIVQGVDFILTDPEGRQLGYTEKLGRLDEIPNVFFSEDSSTESENFVVFDRLPGQYTLEFFGSCDEDAMVVIGDDQDGTLIYGCPPISQTPPDPTSVPEPSTLLGLVLLGGFFAKLKKTR